MAFSVQQKSLIWWSQSHHFTAYSSRVLKMLWMFLNLLFGLIFLIWIIISSAVHFYIHYMTLYGRISMLVFFVFSIQSTSVPKSSRKQSVLFLPMYGHGSTYKKSSIFSDQMNVKMESQTLNCKDLLYSTHKVLLIFLRFLLFVGNTDKHWECLGSRVWKLSVQTISLFHVLKMTWI